MDPTVPSIDAGARRRLTARFGGHGDAAFDAVDLVLWRADDLETIKARADWVAAAAGMETRRVLAWCSAFASMNAPEMASQVRTPSARIEALRQLASQA